MELSKKKANLENFAKQKKKKNNNQKKKNKI